MISEIALQCNPTSRTNPGSINPRVHDIYYLAAPRLLAKSVYISTAWAGPLCNYSAQAKKYLGRANGNTDVIIVSIYDFIAVNHSIHSRLLLEGCYGCLQCHQRKNNAKKCSIAAFKSMPF